MKTKEEIKDWLLENCVNDFGNLDLSDLDFGDFEGDVILSGMIVKKNLYQSYQIVGGHLSQYSNLVVGNLYQSFQRVKGNLLQSYQEVNGNLDQNKQNVKGCLFQEYQIVDGVTCNYIKMEIED